MLYKKKWLNYKNSKLSRYLDCGNYQHNLWKILSQIWVVISSQRNARVLFKKYKGNNEIMNIVRVVTVHTQAKNREMDSKLWRWNAVCLKGVYNDLSTFHMIIFILLLPSKNKVQELGEPRYLLHTHHLGSWGRMISVSLKPFLATQLAVIINYNKRFC